MPFPRFLMNEPLNMADVPQYGTAAYGSAGDSGAGPQGHEKKLDTTFNNEDDRSSLYSEESAQAGVKRIEAISTAWTKWSLALAYVG